LLASAHAKGERLRPVGGAAGGVLAGSPPGVLASVGVVAVTMVGAKRSRSSAQMAGAS